MIIKRDIDFAPTGKTRTLHIHLPEGYGETDERYPVMYFFDGHNLFSDEDATYGQSWGLREFLEGWEKPMIVVGIECGHEGRERLVEYCPYHIRGGFLGEIDGVGAATVNWMADELKPMIDRTYRTYGFREATGIGGSSMGGLMSLYAVVCRNDVFSKAACLSSTLSPCMKELEADIARSGIDPDTRVYLSWGKKEAGRRRDAAAALEAYHEKMRALLLARGANVRLFGQEEGRHCEADWARQVRPFMDFLWLDR